jgi:hypothetical protein
MDDQPSCGKGLAEHSALPTTLGELMGAVAEVLEVHTRALDLTDEHSRKEHEAYLELVSAHRRLATDLRSLAARMAGYRALPMGRHDEEQMAAPEGIAAFERFVRREGELHALLDAWLTRDRQMLGAMGAGEGGAVQR